LLVWDRALSAAALRVPGRDRLGQADLLVDLLQHLDVGEGSDLDRLVGVMDLRGPMDESAFQGNRRQRLRCHAPMQPEAKCGATVEWGSQVGFHDLDHLADTWAQPEFEDFEKQLVAQRSIDEERWR